MFGFNQLFKAKDARKINNSVGKIIDVSLKLRDITELIRKTLLADKTITRLTYNLDHNPEFADKRILSYYKKLKEELEKLGYKVIYIAHHSEKDTIYFEIRW